MLDERYRTVLEARTRRPEAIAEAAARRARPVSLFNDHGRLMMIAADHPARGALRAGDRALAMADRVDLLDRLCLALSRPGVNGVLGTPDVLEDLLLLGALDNKVVVGSMNRGGLAGTVFEIDDRFTAYDADSLARDGFEGGKMLLRIDPDDPSTVATVEACGRAVSELAARRLHGHGRAVHRPPGRRPGPDRPRGRGVHPGHDRGRRHRQHLRLHLAQGPGGGGDGAGHGRHHPARGAAGRRGLRRPGRGLRELAQGPQAPHRPGPGHRPVAAVPAGRRRRRGRRHRGGPDAGGDR